MDTRHKHLLQQHRVFLARNIVWSESLVEQLRAQGLLSDYMVKDIENYTTREDKVRKFIDLLPLKGNSQAFNKFLDILQTSGHVFIADFLREDEDLQKVFDIQDMFKQLPFVKRCFNDTERKQVETYLSEKIESQVLKLTWRRADREKDKALEAKQQQIEQAYEFQVKQDEQSKAKADTIAKLQQEINSAVGDRADLKAKLEDLSKLHEEQEKRHRDALAVQMKYNHANDNTITRGNEKFAIAENVLKVIKQKLDNVMKIYKETHVPPPTAVDAQQIRDMIKAQGDFFFLNQDIDVFLNKFNELLEDQKCHEKLKKDRDYILIHFGWDKVIEERKDDGEDVDENEEVSLTKAYKHFLVTNEEEKQTLKDEITRLENLLQGTHTEIAQLYKENEDMVAKLEQGAQTWQSAIMNVMRKQLHENKTDIRRKDTRLSMQDEENAKLKKRIAELEALNKSYVALREDIANENANANTATATLPAKQNIDDNRVIESPLPVKKNLPPLKSSTLQVHTKVAAVSKDTTPVQRPSKSRGTPVLVTARQFQPPDSLKGHMNSYPSHLPQSRGGFRGTPMGSVVDNLKAMNKHQIQNTARKGFNTPLK